MPVQDTAETTVDDASRMPRPSRSADRRMLIDGRLVSADGRFPRSTPPPETSSATPPTPASRTPRRRSRPPRRAFDTTTWSTDVELRIRCLDQLHQALRRPRARNCAS